MNGWMKFWMLVATALLTVFAVFGFFVFLGDPVPLMKIFGIAASVFSLSAILGLWTASAT